ncbi:MAG: hypothetical protein K0R54_5340 [Clostridiaceae bacterium]|nr:hypothetical protein [Clostridiaceae bacterium]
MKQWINKITYPLLFQGDLKLKDYFEGWYYKQVSKDERKAVIFIPGISLFHNDVNSFIQYINISLDENREKIIETGYVKYSMRDFKFSNNPFMIQIGPNIFSESMISINISDKGMNVEGTLELGPLTPIKKSVLMPNIMGFFAYIPKMECYHGIASMNHVVNGVLKINGEQINFNSGNGYIEKDWGTSFPKKYIWIQCNNFKNENTSFFASIAFIPFMKKSFLGHICNLAANGKEYRFATYNNSKFKIENITDENVTLLFENSKGKLRIEADLKKHGQLIAPKLGEMNRKIKEGFSERVKIYLYNKHNEIIYEDTGTMASIEIVGFNCNNVV